MATKISVELKNDLLAYLKPYRDERTKDLYARLKGAKRGRKTGWRKPENKT